MDLRAQLIRDEGLRLFPYTDTVGKLTIGVGRNLTDCGISRAEAEHLLDNDIAKVAADVAARLPWVADLLWARRAAIMNLAFNLGIDGLLKFKNTLAAAERGDWKATAAGIRNSKYAQQVGARAERIAKQLETGEWV